MNGLIGFKKDILDSIIEYEQKNDCLPNTKRIGMINGIHRPEVVRMYLRDLQRGGFILLDGSGEPRCVINIMNTQGVKRDACD